MQQWFGWLIILAVVAGVAWIQLHPVPTALPSYNVYHTPGACVYITGTTTPHIAVIPKTALYSFGTFQGC
jgi:hypothetical protein